MRNLVRYARLAAAIAILEAGVGYSQQASVVKPDTNTTVTTGGGTTNYIPQFTGASTIGDSIIYATGNSVGIGDVPNSSVKLDVNGAIIMRGEMIVSRTGNATASQGFPSYGFEFFSNVYNSSSKTGDNPYFQLQSEPTGNNTASPSATFNLLFANNGGAIAETGFYINPNGTLHFASAQSFPIAAGPQGPAGPTGPAGATGPQGPAGPAGTITLPYAGQADGGGNILFYLQNTGKTGGPGLEVSGAASADLEYYSGGYGVSGNGGNASTILGPTYGGPGVQGYGGEAFVGGSTGGVGGFFYGGYGSSSAGGDGVDAYAGSSSDAGIGGDGLYASVNGNGTLAGEFEGDVYVGGNLSKLGGSFKIDHPLDPENKYLYHSFVESPDMKNIYDGNVTTDSSGRAVVTMPDWFEALNRDFRYQLTAIGSPARVWIGMKVTANRFVIQSDEPNVEVSWQVTGIRQDAWANAHRIPVEEEKSARDKGHYLTPELFGQTREEGIMELHHPTPARVRRVAPAKAQP